jgi:hypothetical protein
VLVAVCLVAILAFLALVIDVGNAYAQRRQTQNAADAGALAGAHELAIGSSTSEIQARANEYAVQRNGADSAQVGVNSDTVTVTATKTFPTFFAGIVGLSELTVTVTAEASVISQPGGGGYAIWGHDQSDSKTVHFSGANVNVVGGVHSNAGIHSTGVNLTVLGLLDYVTSWQMNGSNLHIGNPPYEFSQPPGCGCNLWIGTPPPRQTTVQPWPVNYQMPDYQPGGRAAQAAQAQGKYYNHGSGWSISGQIYHVPSGLHYTNGNVDFSGSNLYFDQGPVTIVATGTYASVAATC